MTYYHLFYSLTSLFREKALFFYAFPLFAHKYAPLFYLHNFYQLFLANAIQIIQVIM